MGTRREPRVETLHGVPVADPYRWLEDAASEEVAAWTRAQNERTARFLEGCPERGPLRARVAAMLETGFVSAPWPVRGPRGWRFFWTKRTGGAVQPTLWVRDDGGDARALIDVASLSADGTDALDWWYPSQDGSLLAWGRSASGSEKSELFVRDVDRGVDLEDRIPHTRHASVAWVAKDRFFYARHPEPGTVPPGDEDYHQRIYEHVLGRSWRKDPLAFGEGRAPEDCPIVAASPDGRWLVVRVHQGWDKSEVYARDLRGGDWITIAEGERALFDPIPTDEGLWLMTNAGAPRWRLLFAPWDALGRFGASGWREVLAERADVLVSALPQKGRVVAAYLRDASTAVALFGADGASRGEVDLGTFATAGLAGAHDADEAFVDMVSFVTPPRVLRVGADGAASEWDAVRVAGGVPDVVVERAVATSKDGTRVPMFVVRPRALPEDPVAIVWGYGGFNVNQTPAFSVRALAAVERGCVFASCVLRGGGELGEEWHRAGMLERKQNVFDDFAACIEELQRRGLARPERTAILGGSNGGLLVAATAVQRPELFGAGVSLVPLCDMLRYHLYRIGKLWIPEYGDPDDPAHFPFLRAYSPYHSVRDGARYPAMLFATAEADSRVDPMHARKMAALLQEHETDARPVLLRVETKAGHGQGKPTSKLAEEVADELAFLLFALGGSPAARAAR